MPFFNPIDHIDFSPTKEKIMVVNSNREIELYYNQQKNSDRFFHQFKNKGSKVLHFAVNWKTEKAVISWDDNTVKIYDLQNGHEGFTLGSIKFDSPVTALAMNINYITVASNGKLFQ